MSEQVFLYRHDAGINPQQLQKLRRSGFIPVGVESLSSAKVLEPVVVSPQFQADLVLRAAMEGLVQSDFAMQTFTKALAKAIINAPKDTP